MLSLMSATFAAGVGYFSSTAAVVGFFVLSISAASPLLSLNR
jgi:hypothetical protein